MVELAALEKRCGGNVTQGSNPCLSATKSPSSSSRRLFCEAIDIRTRRGENSQWQFEGNLPMATGLPIAKFRGRAGVTEPCRCYQRKYPTYCGIFSFAKRQPYGVVVVVSVIPKAVFNVVVYVATDFANAVLAALIAASRVVASALIAVLVDSG